MTRLEEPPIEPPPPEPVYTAEPVEDDAVEVMDPAQRSLSDALRVSFTILKVLMVFLVIAYLFSGIFRVKEQQKAVLLVFGRIVGEAGQQVYDSGWHLGPPYPLGEVVEVPIAPQELKITQAFWYETGEGDLGMSTADRARRAGPLNPLKDGSLLTGDANIVHARYDVKYSVGDAVAYIENVGDQELAREFVRDAVERGIVHAVAQIEADELIGGRANANVARLRAQEVLDELNTGIRIITFTAGQTEMPLSVFNAYKEVSNAESEKASAINQARTEYAEVLGKTAGRAYPALYELIQQFEQASARQDAERADELADELNQSIADLRMSPQRGGQPIGGEVAEVINQAKSRRTDIVQSIKGEAETFQLLLEDYHRRPGILMNRLWEETREEIFTGDVEVIYVPNGLIYLELGSDPEFQNEQYEKRRKKKQEERRQN